MQNIRGHKSWNEEEIIQILCQHGEFTMCTLPHDRYTRVQGICRKLKALGLIQGAGKAPNGINYTITDLFKTWRQEHASGTTRLGPVKWRKQRWRQRLSDNDDADPGTDLRGNIGEYWHEQGDPSYE
jgi:hypothetical protein